jgi:hypothetical protein
MITKKPNSIKAKKVNRAKWHITADRFVAFIDIMGFKNLVNSHSHDEVLSKMYAINKIVKPLEQSAQIALSTPGKRIPEDADYNFEHAIIRPVIFSDSIVLITNSDKISDAKAIVFNSIVLIQECLNLGIPVKGCISYGEFSADIDNSIFFGQPLINAYLLQEELNQYGIIVDHSFQKFISGKDIFLEDIVVEYPTPLKAGIISHLNLNWALQLEEDQDIKSSLDSFYHSVSGAPRKYVDNTIKFFEKFHKEVWQDI